MTNDFSSMTILLVDDTPDNIRILNELLGEFKRKVAVNGEKALAIANGEQRPDLILLDINMPGLSGLEVCEELKKHTYTRDIPIIFLTAQSDRETTIKGFKLGANDYITKPFDPEELMMRVKTQLNLKLQKNIIEQEKKKSDDLLLNILPVEVAKELKEYGVAKPKYYEQATVMFADIVGFTNLSKGKTPDVIVSELNAIFLGMDEILEKHHLEKIKTMGDGYMAVGGVPVKNNTNARDAITAGLEMIEFVKGVKDIEGNSGLWNLRIGLHTGELIAGVIGKRKFAFDVWGDTVNIASRMESGAEPGTVNISNATYELVKNQFSCIPRGKLPVKNMGELEMYQVSN